MKTIKQWLEELPEPYRTQALENTEEELLDSELESISDALYYGFGWDNSPQGGIYWYELYKKLQQETLVNKE